MINSSSRELKTIMNDTYKMNII